MMQGLGNTRSAYRRDHLLQTPDAFVRAPLPGMEKVTAITHMAPAGGAAFTQYTAEFEANGRVEKCAQQRFVYVLEGELEVDGKVFQAGDYIYFPAGSGRPLLAKTKARAAIIEKPYQDLENVKAPYGFSGRESERDAQPLMGDEDLMVRSLVPADACFDFAVNTMTFQPGATLPMVEIHFMEHGLMMLSGAGIYKLGDCWYPAVAGDFIWMAPYCPQWFGALGKTPAKYLIYKDWNRHPAGNSR